MASRGNIGYELTGPGFEPQSLVSETKALPLDQLAGLIVFIHVICSSDQHAQNKAENLSSVKKQKATTDNK